MFNNATAGISIGDALTLRFTHNSPLDLIKSYNSGQGRGALPILLLAYIVQLSCILLQTACRASLDELAPLNSHV